MSAQLATQVALLPTRDVHQYRRLVNVQVPSNTFHFACRPPKLVGASPTWSFAGNVAWTGIKRILGLLATITACGPQVQDPR